MPVYLIVAIILILMYLFILFLIREKEPDEQKRDFTEDIRLFSHVITGKELNENDQLYLDEKNNEYEDIAQKITLTKKEQKIVNKAKSIFFIILGAVIAYFFMRYGYGRSAFLIIGYYAAKTLPILIITVLILSMSDSFLKDVANPITILIKKNIKLLLELLSSILIITLIFFVIRLCILR